MAVVIDRVFYALVAYVVSYAIGRYLVGLELESVKEVSLLNAALAYYTHEAAGKVVKAVQDAVAKVFRAEESLRVEETKHKET